MIELCSCREDFMSLSPSLVKHQILETIRMKPKLIEKNSILKTFSIECPSCENYLSFNYGFEGKFNWNPRKKFSIFFFLFSYTVVQLSFIFLYFFMGTSEPAEIMMLQDCAFIFLIFLISTV